MIADALDEPTLEFAGGARHIDPPGLAWPSMAPADLETESAPRTIERCPSR